MDMERGITVSEQVYVALQRQAARSHTPLDALAESWLRQHLDWTLAKIALTTKKLVVC
jgi:hypothetical protein